MDIKVAIDTFLFLINVSVLAFFGYKTVSFFLTSILEKLVSLHIVIWTNLVLTTSILSLFYQLNNEYLYLILSCGLSFYFYTLGKKYAILDDVKDFSEDLRSFQVINFKFLKADKFSLVLVITYAIMCFILFFLCINYYPRNLDYTREVLLGLLFYIQDGSILTSSSLSPYSIGFSFPFNGLLYNSIFAIYKQSHHYFLLTSFINWLVCSFSIYLIARKIGGSKRASLIAAYLFMMSQPIVITGSMEMNDIQLYGSMIAGVVFVFDFFKTKHPFYSLIIGLAWGLSFGTKYLSAFFLLGFILFFCYFLFSKERRLFLFKFIHGNQKAIYIGAFAAVLMLAPEIQKYLLHTPHESFSEITEQHTRSVSAEDARIVQKQSVLYGTIWGYSTNFSFFSRFIPSLKQFILFHLDFFLSPLYNIPTTIFGDKTLISDFFSSMDNSFRAFLHSSGIGIPDGRAPFLRPDHSPVTYLMVHSLYSYPIYIAIFLILSRRIKNKEALWLVIFYFSFVYLFSLLKFQSHHTRYILTSFFVVAPIVALFYDRRLLWSKSKKVLVDIFFIFLLIMTFWISWRAIVNGPYENSYRANQVRAVFDKREHNLDYYNGYVRRAMMDAKSPNIFFNNHHHYTDMMRREPYKKYTILDNIIADRTNFLLLPPAYVQPYIWQYDFFLVPVYAPMLQPDEGFIFLNKVWIDYNMFVNNLGNVDYSFYPKPRYLMFGLTKSPQPDGNFGIRIFLMRPAPTKTKLEFRLLMDFEGADANTKRVIFPWEKDKFLFEFAVGPNVRVVYLQLKKDSSYGEQQEYTVPISLNPQSIDVRQYIQQQ